MSISYENTIKNTKESQKNTSAYEPFSNNPFNKFVSEIVDSKKEEIMQSFIIEGGHPLQGTIKPQGAKNEALQIICAVIFIVAYCVYAASSIVACGDLFNSVLGWDKSVAMIGSTIVILVYTSSAASTLSAGQTSSRDF